jgi:hypothetical protein
MGVSYDQASGRIVLAYNPQWMIQPLTEPWVLGETETEPWTDGNLVAVLEHECLHIVLKHLIRHPQGNRQVWNIAEDMVINQQLTGLPRGCVTLSFMGQTYPPNLHADGYYKLLQQNMPPCPIPWPRGKTRISEPNANRARAVFVRPDKQ